MANVKKANRVQDTDIKRLNHVGLGLKAIAELLGCHPATITLRLKAMAVEPIDTRRSFMEQVFLSLSREEQEWLSHNLFNAGLGIREFVTTLIKEAFAAAPAVAPAPVAMPVMQTVTETVAAVAEAVPATEKAPEATPAPVVAIDPVQPAAEQTVVQTAPVQAEIPQVTPEHVEDSIPTTEIPAEKPQSLFK